VTPPFDSFVAIDWSGAKGTRHKGIAIAEALGDAAPRLVRAGHVWARAEVGDELRECLLPRPEEDRVGVRGGFVRARRHVEPAEGDEDAPRAIRIRKSVGAVGVRDVDLDHGDVRRVVHR